MEILKFLKLPEFTYKGRIKVKGVGGWTLFWLTNGLYGDAYLNEGIKTVGELIDYINSKDNTIWKKFPSFPSKLMLEKGLQYLQEVLSKYGLPEIKFIKEAHRKKLSPDVTIPEFLELPEFRYYGHKDKANKVKGVGYKTIASIDYTLYDEAYLENNIKTLGELIDSIQNKQISFYSTKAERYFNHLLSKYGLQPLSF